MRGKAYHLNAVKKHRSRVWLFIPIVILLVAGGLLARQFINSSPEDRTANQLRFDDSVTENEKVAITRAIAEQKPRLQGDANVSIKTVTVSEDLPQVAAYVPVTSFNSVRQKVSLDELKQVKFVLPADIDGIIKQSIAEMLDKQVAEIGILTDPIEELSEDQITLIPANRLAGNVKLLAFNDAYYLDSFTAGAFFRQAEFKGEGARDLAEVRLSDLPRKADVLTLNQTGVTALTRKMIVKLPSVSSAAYFSEKIGDFLGAADITHVSNEVSFKAGCTVDNIRFCSPPQMIEALKASGVDVVELTGNHNNDVGAEYNTESIKLYQSLGWGIFGGGLNAEEAAKPYKAEKKGTKLALLGYNYADGSGSGALAGVDRAGANGFDEERIKSDISAAKAEGNYVIVDVQFYECYAYPEGYVEYPQCDSPIPNQKEVFREIIDLGADMVVGSSAHQPQTYELYKGKPIFYGLGNMYFEQVEWPGTERGIILTHYLIQGKLVQTKLTPTVYDRSLQTRIMDDMEATKLFDRLIKAQPAF